MGSKVALLECAKKELTSAELLALCAFFGSDTEFVEISPTDTKKLSASCSTGVRGVFFKEGRRIPKVDAMLLRAVPFVYSSYDPKRGMSLRRLTSITYVSVDLNNQLQKVSAV